MEVAWMVFISIVVFLIVFFVAWGLRVKPLTAVALACIWTLLIQCIMLPTSLATLKTLEWSGWWGAYWILAVGFFIYLIFYVTYMATKDHEHPKHHHHDHDHHEHGKVIEVSEMDF